MKYQEYEQLMLLLLKPFLAKNEQDHFAQEVQQELFKRANVCYPAPSTIHYTMITLDNKKNLTLSHCKTTVQREYDIQRKFGAHPHIVQLLDVIDLNNESFATVLEYCPGHDLDRYIKQHQGGVDEKDARPFLVQILSTSLVCCPGASVLRKKKTRLTCRRLLFSSVLQVGCDISMWELMIPLFIMT